jgi:hypothetical protein
VNMRRKWINVNFNQRISPFQIKFGLPIIFKL